jgi:DNA repair protein RadC
MKYTDMPKADQPTQRIREHSGKALTNAELYAVALRMVNQETAQALALLRSEYGSLNRVPRERLVAIPGIGDNLADAIQAIAEIARRETLEGRAERAMITSPADAAMLVQYEMGGLEHEEMWVILLSTRNHVLRIVHLYKGSVNSNQVRVGEVFRDAIREQAAAIIVIHNHPSGDVTPSPDDVAVTRAIVQAGNMLNIDVLDHLIIATGRWTSLKERCLGF